MHDTIAAELLREVQILIRLQMQNNALQREILSVLKHPHHDNRDRVTGGFIKEKNPMLPISPGNAPKFQVTPTFSGEPFILDGTKASVTSSDTTNFPVALDPADTEGRTIIADIPSTAQPVGGSEDVVVTWTYTNADGVVATVTGTVTEVGIVDDVTGGTFAQVA